jgi:uncharacterized protein (DUF2141 family)
MHLARTPVAGSFMMYRLAAATPLFVALAGNAPTAELEIRLERLRNQRGVLHLCLTRNPQHFPDCGKDAQAVKHSIASAAGPIRFTGLVPGTYALAVMHDENRNGKLDTLMSIPREGFAFSRNPVVRFGPPRFDQVRLNLAAGITRHTVRMQYLL